MPQGYEVSDGVKALVQAVNLTEADYEQAVLQRVQQALAEPVKVMPTIVRFDIVQGNGRHPLAVIASSLGTFLVTGKEADHLESGVKELLVRLKLG